MPWPLRKQLVKTDRIEKENRDRKFDCAGTHTQQSNPSTREPRHLHKRRSDGGERLTPRDERQNPEHIDGTGRSTTREIATGLEILRREPHQSRSPTAATTHGQTLGIQHEDKQLVVYDDSKWSGELPVNRRDFNFSRQSAAGQPQAGALERSHKPASYWEFRHDDGMTNAGRYPVTATKQRR